LKCTLCILTSYIGELWICHTTVRLHHQESRPQKVGFLVFPQNINNALSSSRWEGKEPKSLIPLGDNHLKSHLPEFNEVLLGYAGVCNDEVDVLGGDERSNGGMSDFGMV